MRDDVPSGTWRLLGSAAVFMLIVAIAGISLISSGAFDPATNGALQSTLQLTPQKVTAGTSTLRWLDVATPDHYSLRLRAKAAEGAVDVGYGLAIGDDEAYTLVALSPLGYLTLRNDYPGYLAVSGGPDRSKSQETDLPWQTWPHIRTGSQSNEIWIDVSKGKISAVRINRELLRTRELPLEGNMIGLWAEGFDDDATIEFLELELFY